MIYGAALPLRILTSRQQGQTEKEGLDLNSFFFLIVLVANSSSSVFSFLALG